LRKHHFITSDWTLLFLNGSFPASFLFFVFSIQLTVNIQSNFANDWIWTSDLWSQKRPLYQLSHNHCPTSNRPQWKIIFIVSGPVLQKASFLSILGPYPYPHLTPVLIFEEVIKGISKLILLFAHCWQGSKQVWECISRDGLQVEDQSKLANVCRLLTYTRWSSGNKLLKCLHSVCFSSVRCIWHHNVSVNCNQSKAI